MTWPWKLAGASVVYGGVALAGWVASGPELCCEFAVPAGALAFAAGWQWHRARQRAAWWAAWWTAEDEAFLDGKTAALPAVDTEQRDGRHR